ncbi:hypothetical protein AURDEDRAFT_75228 [Auricularia subglabra TFB-10046 SS5]|nr:hypothetical protein AURDEDRAFT_75228 [Auricularia subglabra TFB-10046 SS5]
MHLVWLNLIPNLVALWTGKFKGLDVGTGDYELASAVWEQIGRTTGASGATIPGAFGARVPDLAKDKTYMIAETWCIWTLHIAPIVLRGRFPQERYYNHFIELVQLLERCLKLELNTADVEAIRTGFISWVKRYEQLYYQHNPSRLSTCVSTVHALLHIADSIAAMGPVGCYWSFVMERFCSSLRPAIRSRKYPYTSIDNYSMDLARLRQIRLAYGRDKYFNPQLETAEALCAARFAHCALTYVCLLTDPFSALKAPSKLVELTTQERKAIARHLSVRFGDHARTLLRLVPAEIMVWGRVERLDGGDTIRAHRVGKLRHDNRDASFVRYALDVDRHARHRNVESEFDTTAFFGQLLRIFVLELPPLPEYEHPLKQTALLAEVQECHGLTEPDRAGVRYFDGSLATAQVIDLACIECLVGRMEDRGRWALIDRSNELARTVMPKVVPDS